MPLTTKQKNINFSFNIRNREQNGKLIEQDCLVFIKTRVINLATQQNNAAVFFESLVFLANAGCRDSQFGLAQILSLNPNNDYCISFNNHELKLTSEFKQKIISCVVPSEQQNIIQIVFNNMSSS